MPPDNLHMWKHFAVYKLNDDSIHHAFVEAALVKIRSKWSEDIFAGQIWAVLKDGILESGRHTLGTDNRCGLEATLKP